MVDKMVVSDIEIEVIKKSIKNMHLYVLPPIGDVRISAPMGAKDEAIKLFAITKIGWIKKQVEKFQNQQRQSEREYVSGESHYLWGRRYKLEIQYTKTANKVEIKGNKLILTIRETSTRLQREKVMTEWYRAEIKAKLPALIEKWEETIGVKADAISVKNMRTRWGTCNTKGKRVWINLQLAKKPITCLEYIVVHELVHLIEKNHTPVFIGYMDKLLPDWRVTKEELNSFIMDRYLEE
jgi:predicted metal-dependent hydrolase